MYSHKHICIPIIYLQFAEVLAKQTFNNSENRAKIYFDILIYSYLHTLCESRVILNVNGARSVYLLCDNSLKTQKSKLKRILQSYAPDCEYVDTFPAHRQHAVDFYLQKANDNKKKLLSLINPNQLKMKCNKNNINMNNMVNKQKNNNSNILRIYPFQDMVEIISELMATQNQQQFVMSNLSGRIATLEHNTINTDMVIDNQQLFNQLDEMIMTSKT